MSIDRLFDDAFKTFKTFDTFFTTVNTTNMAAAKYPPYNYVMLDNGKYQITLAVAGFEKDDLDVEEKTEDGVKQLFIKATPSKKFDDTEVKFLHRGLANRAFNIKFKIDKLDVEHIRHNNGLLTIDLKSIEPETGKTKKFEIE